MVLWGTLAGTNCYLVGTGSERLLLDTGEGKAEFHEILRALLASLGCQISGILLTHSHVDHLGGLPQVLRSFPTAPVWRCHPAAGLPFGRLGTAEAINRFVTEELVVQQVNRWSDSDPNRALAALASGDARWKQFLR
ncbi:encB [Symbiodinium microadriaticum]|nr:encB [Symbiodinium microadriaticum]